MPQYTWPYVVKINVLKGGLDKAYQKEYETEHKNFILLENQLKETKSEVNRIRLALECKEIRSNLYKTDKFKDLNLIYKWNTVCENAL